MKRWLRGAACVVVLILAAIAGSFAWGRLRPPSDTQRDALSLLQPGEAPKLGHNAWATFTMLGYDIPLADVDAAYATERQRMFEWFATWSPSASAPTDFYEFAAAKTYPMLPTISLADQKTICTLTDKDCLAKLRLHAADVPGILASRRSKLLRLDAMSTADYMWNDTPPTVYVPFPAFGDPAYLALTAAAQQFVSGDKARGLAMACKGAATVRHLHAGTNSLLGSMIMVSWMSAYERLIAEMLQEAQQDRALPADCNTAFASVTQQDVNMCPAAQYEFQFAKTMLAESWAAEKPAWRRFIYFSISPTNTLMAQRYASLCKPSTREAMLSDQKFTHESGVFLIHADRFDRFTNALGVKLLTIASPDFSSYLNRQEDFASGLRFFAVFLAARNDGASRDDLQKKLLVFNTPDGRKATLDADGEHMRMTYYQPQRGRTELVLPVFH